MTLETVTIAAPEEILPWWERAPQEAARLYLLPKGGLEDQTGEGAGKPPGALDGLGALIFPPFGEVVPVLVRPHSFQAWSARRDAEHRAILEVLEEALTVVAKQDADLACRLAARAYVHLKTDPRGQGRFNGLLHRWTGATHRAGGRTSDQPASK